MHTILILIFDLSYYILYIENNADDGDDDDDAYCLVECICLAHGVNPSNQCSLTRSNQHEYVDTNANIEEDTIERIRRTEFNQSNKHKKTTE